MNINRTNYEAFFLDYHEGNLTPQQVAELLLFVEQHSELKQEFESFENFSLEDFSSITFENKSSLKKEITIGNREEYFIRAIENNLNPAEQQLVNRFLKKHPQFKTDFELFQKTKLQADLSVVFEDKNVLKDIAITTDYLLIAAVEGLLTRQETSMLNHQLAVDAEMKQNYALYQQTKLSADAAVIFENKQELKRRERKVIPLYYYVAAAAAAITLLFGLSVLFNNPTSEDKKLAGRYQTDSKTVFKNNTVPENNAFASADSENPTIKTHAVRTGKSKKIDFAAASKKQPNVVTPVTNEAPQQTVVAKENPENKEQPVAVSPEKQINAVAPVTNEQPAIAQARPEVKTNNNSAFLSIGEIAAAKIKQKTMDKDELSSEKKAGKLNKFSGWDALQVVAKGVSRLTGKKIEVKPTYNDEGEVTAYAFNAGKIGFSKER